MQARHTDDSGRLRRRRKLSHHSKPINGRHPPGVGSRRSQLLRMHGVLAWYKTISGNLQNGSSVEFTITKFLQRCIGFLKGKNLNLRVHRHPRRKLEKLFAVSPRKIRDLGDNPLVPEINIWKCGNVGHMNSATHYDAGFYKMFQRDRYQRPD